MQFTRYSGTEGYNNEQEQQGWFNNSTDISCRHTHMQGRIKTQLGVMLQQWRHQAMPTPSPPLPLPLLLSFLSL